MEKGSIKHNIRTRNNVRTDTFKVNIPLSLIENSIVETLNYWCVEQFDGATIDWAEDKMVLTYKTQHYV